MLSSSETEALLSKLCIELGFCLDADGDKTLIESAPETVDEFTRKVF
jgi:hypothetical protein